MSLSSQGVESEQCASFNNAMDAGHPIYTKSGPTLADGKNYYGLLIGCLF